ncbi:MAG TPA: hypothetical protein VEM41_04815 [Actinomycetota bacterium]|nr:hypothetical protein [Actinomycetota bacterium]
MPDSVENGMRVGVMDLGSSSFRLDVAEAGPSGRIRHLVRKREDLFLGLVVGREGRVPDAEADAAVEAVRRLQRVARRQDVDHLIVVATSALRDAANRDEMAKRLGKALGEPVRFLTGDDEAKLTYAAMRAHLRLNGDPLLGVDLGGGSLELAAGHGETLERTWSLPLGSARLTGKFVRSDPMTSAEADRLSLYVRNQLRPVVVAHGNLERVAVAGGTAKALARLLAPKKRSVSGMILTGEALWSLRDLLTGASLHEKLELPGMVARRAGVIGAGAVVLSSLVAMLRVPGLTVSEWGVREGIILEAVGLVPDREPAVA